MSRSFALLRRIAPFPALWRAGLRWGPRRAIPVTFNNRVNRYFATRARHFVASTRYGFDLSGNTGDLIQRYIYLYGVWEPNLSTWLWDRLGRGDGFVDVGANAGYYTLLAAQRVGREGSVTAIEASPAIFPLLKANAELNRAENTRLVHCAVLDAIGEIELFPGPSHNLGATSIFQGDVGDSVRVEAKPLCEILSPGDLASARIMKIDVEGAEVQAILGLVPCLEHARPDLEFVVEVGGGPEGSQPAAEAAGEIIRLLEPYGYHAYTLMNDYRAEAYVRERAARPVRLRGPVASETDLVFSRLDRPSL